MTRDPLDTYLETVERAALEWPRPLGPEYDRASAQSAFRGSLVWGAIGDALGAPYEHMPGEDIAADLEAHGGVHQVPFAGRYTDDTQLTIVVAESLLASGGRFDGDDFARRLRMWLPSAIGIGIATSRAVRAMDGGRDWRTAGVAVNSGGNGAAMRAAPVGLLHAFDADPTELLAEAVRFAYPTHTHPIGVASAAVMAAAVAYLARERTNGRTELNASELVDFIATIADLLAPEAVPERRLGTPARLGARLRRAADTDRGPREVFEEFHSGAFALESVPCAFYAFLCSPTDPVAVLRTSLIAGHDVDTIAAMAGNLVGAFTGMPGSSHPKAWLDNLQDSNRLVELADGLFVLSGSRYR